MGIKEVNKKIIFNAQFHNYAQLFKNGTNMYKEQSCEGYENTLPRTVDVIKFQITVKVK